MRNDLAPQTDDMAAFYDFEQTRERFRPVGRKLGRNQMYGAFRKGQVPGGIPIGGRWYAYRRKFDRAVGA